MIHPENFPKFFGTEKTSPYYNKAPLIPWYMYIVLFFLPKRVFNDGLTRVTLKTFRGSWYVLKDEVIK